MIYNMDKSINYHKILRNRLSIAEAITSKYRARGRKSFLDYYISEWHKQNARFRCKNKLNGVNLPKVFYTVPPPPSFMKRKDIFWEDVIEHFRDLGDAAKDWVWRHEKARERKKVCSRIACALTRRCIVLG